MDIAVDLIHIVEGGLPVIQLGEGVYDLQMVAEIVTLGAQGGVELFQLGVGFQQHLPLGGGPASGAGFAYVQRRAPDDHERRGEQQCARRPAAELHIAVEQGICRQQTYGKNLAGVYDYCPCGNL